MSLPPGFLEELRSRTTLSAVVGRKVTWDQRKSNLAKGDWWAPCPFHQEKSASFHVDDRKGFYYCFGCHAKGDAVTFVKETENLSFIEAVESLARGAGMQMPERDPRAAQVSDRRSQLISVVEESVKWFRLQLKTSAAAEARAYLAKRGLSEAAQDRWDIGFAPDQRQALFAALTQKGIAPDLIVASGVCALPDESSGDGRGGAPYDRFRGRIIFPIRDGRGRAISLGGRSMDPNARAKYLNGPETEIFDKGRNLYNHAPAREAAAKGAPLIVAEGYMDVIALSEAGFKGAVAPLGTAVTEEQLHLMWRIHDEPIIALDGDKAGIRAALRVVDLALPLLQAGKGLRFVVLPDGQDPDDLIKAHGAAAMQKLLDQAQPMVRLLWQRETEGRVLDSPERKASLDKSLRAALKRITDPSIRAHYGEDIKHLRWELFGQGPRGGTAAPRRAGQNNRFVPKGTPLPPVAGTRASDLGRQTGVDDTLSEAVILAILIVHPDLIARFESDLDAVQMFGPGHRDLRDALVQHAHSAREFLREQLLVDLAGPMQTLFARPHVATAPPVIKTHDPDLAALCLAEEFAKLTARRAVIREIDEASLDITGLVDEGLTWRISQAIQARDAAGRSGLSDTKDLGEDRPDLLRQLHSLSDQIGQKKLR